jgi:YidC/Oxa1 family membrane protein insertase
MDKRFFIAVILIFVILFLWPLLFARKRPLPPPSQKSEPEKVQKVETAVKPPEPKKLLSPDTIISVQTPLYDLQLTTDKARVVSWKLKDYLKRSNIKSSEADYMDLIPQDMSGGESGKWLEVSSKDSVIGNELENAQWTVDKKSLSLVGTDKDKDSLEFVYAASNGTIVSKKLIFYRDSYAVDMNVSYYNPSSQEIRMGGYSLLWGPGITKDEKLTDVEAATEGPMSLMKTEGRSKLIKPWRTTGFACFKGKYIKDPDQEGPISWVAFSSKYFVAALIPGPDQWWSDPAQTGKRYSISTNVEETSLSAGDLWKKWGQTTTIALIRPSFPIPAGQTASHSFRIYAGPEKWDILRSVKGMDESNPNVELGRVINFGTFGFLGKVTLWLLNVFYGISRNYGISIIILTILINVMFYPITQKSFKSMGKMQELQPRIAALKEKHRDDPQQLQKETLKVYKRYGVNPMSGCLPLLIQMPVFWALFTTLRGAVELRSAVFIPGWVPDLSLPDTVARIGGFPVNILPLLMTGTMLIQQLFFGTGTTSPGQSNKMMAFMPVIFAFIFYSMPSGLVVYWLFNNILSIGRQYLLGRKKNKNLPVQDEPDDKNNRKKLKIITNK